MKTKLLIADNFARDPDSLRGGALTLNYSTVEFDGHEYHGLAPDSEADRAQLKANIEELVRCPIEIKHSYYRLSPEGNDTTVWIHPDTICSEFAGVLYLNPNNQCRGGTAFWTHVALGWDEIPEAQEITEDLAKLLNEDGNAQERWGVWKINTLAGMKFNRFIFYPSSCFHSRYPREGWGNTKEDSRLVWVVFFDRAKVTNTCL